MHRLRQFTILVFSSLLSACARMPSTQIQTKFHYEAPAKRVALLRQAQCWVRDGVFSVLLSTQSPDIAHFEWRQRGPARYTLHISSALNFYRLDIQQLSTNNVQLRRNGKLIAMAGSPEALMQAAVGWSLPLHGLRWWIAGASVPDHAYEADYDRYGHMTQLRQLGWHLAYSNYMTRGRLDFPQTITLQGYSISAKIVVKTLQENSPCAS